MTTPKPKYAILTQPTLLKETNSNFTFPIGTVLKVRKINDKYALVSFKRLPKNSIRTLRDMGTLPSPNTSWYTNKDHLIFCNSITELLYA